MPRLGAHVSVAGGLDQAIPRATKLGCEAVQIFVKSPHRWSGPELLEPAVAAFHAARRDSPTGPVFAHAAYLCNLATPDSELGRRTGTALRDERERCRRLGLDGLVVHPGAHGGDGEEVGLERIARRLEEVLGAGDGPAILLENTAGQGTALGHRLEHLAWLRDRFPQRQSVGVCLDTCHLHAAGYDIVTPRGFEALVAEVEATLDWEYVRLLHVNDSVHPAGSRRDRHANVDRGEIGGEALARLLGLPALARTPAVLETPKGDDHAGHRTDLELLRALLGLRPPRPYPDRAVPT